MERASDCETEPKDYRFDVWVPMLPMSGQKGKRRYARKRDLIKAIQEARHEELERARQAFMAHPVKVSARFYLPRPTVAQSESVGRR